MPPRVVSILLELSRIKVAGVDELCVHVVLSPLQTSCVALKIDDSGVLRGITRIR